MTQPLAVTANTDPATLALACMAHMQQEEAMLSETVESLRQVRAALLSLGIDALREALDRQARLAQSSVELHERRARLREEMARAMGVAPRSVTLLGLVARLPPEAAVRLADCRERLRAMTADVDRLNRANAALVGQSLDFLGRFLTEITDGGHGGVGYSPTGVARDSVPGSTFEARG